MRSLTHPAHPLHYYRVISVFLLVFNIVVLSVYFGIHCTPMLGTMVDYPNARKFIGITSSIEIIAGILLTVGLASSLTVLSMVSKSSRGRGGSLAFYNDFTCDSSCKTDPPYPFAQITCCRSKTAARARRKGGKRAKAVKSRYELFQLIYYSKGPYYLWKLYVGEAVEFVFQILQLQVSLLFHTSALL